MISTDTIRTKYTEAFDSPGEGLAIYFAPGRINVIGEHTDYNGGFVFPGAVDKGIIAAIRPNGTDRVNAYAADLGEKASFGLTEGDRPKEMWANYIFGVVRELDKQQGVKCGGFDCAFMGDVPLGAGMSSSAALESCFGTALNDFFGDGKVGKFDLVYVGQKTEWNYIGVNCGIMDQFASLHGKDGHIVRLDCKTNEFEYFPFNPKGYSLILLDSMVKHELASSAYNARRKSCENVVAAIKKHHPEVEFLRDADPGMLDEVRGEVSAEDALRAEYVIEEVARVLEVSDALRRGDYETVGQKMYETHHGMSKKYEVSCEELDFLNDLAREMGVTGSRVMGGGFGGCTINLVKDDLREAFEKAATEKYTAKFGHAPKVYEVVISDGARRLA